MMSTVRISLDIPSGGYNLAGGVVATAPIVLCVLGHVFLDGTTG